jgi:hypothetical protein
MSLNNDRAYIIGKNTNRRPGGGRPKKWIALEQFIVEKVKHYWESGAPITSEQLQFLVQQHISSTGNQDAIQMFVRGKQNTLQKFLVHVLYRNNYSIHKITISQSLPVDWRQKAEENSARIREKFRTEKVDIVVNADETFLLLHQLGGLHPQELSMLEQQSGNNKKGST